MSELRVWLVLEASLELLEPPVRQDCQEQPDQKVKLGRPDLRVHRANQVRRERLERVDLVATRARWDRLEVQEALELRALQDSRDPLDPKEQLASRGHLVNQVTLDQLVLGSPDRLVSRVRLVSLVNKELLAVLGHQDHRDFREHQEIRESLGPLVSLEHKVHKGSLDNLVNKVSRDPLALQETLVHRAAAASQVRLDKLETRDSRVQLGNLDLEDRWDRQEILEARAALEQPVPRESWD